MLLFEFQMQMVQHHTQVGEPLELHNHLQHYMLGAGVMGKLLQLDKAVNVLDMVALGKAVLDF